MLAASYSLIGEGMQYTNEEFGILNWAMPNLGQRKLLDSPLSPLSLTLYIINRY